MNDNLANLLANDTNRAVLDYLAGTSAHSDIAEALSEAVAPLGDVQAFCPDLARYRYVVVSTKATIFGFACGMNMIAFRLAPEFKQRSLQTGGQAVPELAPDWVSFAPFQDDWPSVDLPFWARKTYLHARESA